MKGTPCYARLFWGFRTRRQIRWRPAIAVAFGPLAGREAALPELLNETLICLEQGSGTRAILENLLTEYNESISHFRRHVTISNFSVILELVQKNLGVSFVFEILARSSGLATFSLEGTNIQREFNFIYQKNSGNEEKIDYFMK